MPGNTAPANAVGAMPRGSKRAGSARCGATATRGATAAYTSGLSGPNLEERGVWGTAFEAASLQFSLIGGPGNLLASIWVFKWWH